MTTDTPTPTPEQDTRVSANPNHSAAVVYDAPLTFDDFYVLTADEVDAFAVNWTEEPTHPPFYVTVDGKQFAFQGITFLTRGYGAELPDWVKAQEAEGRLVLFVERDDRLLAYYYDPADEEEDGTAEPPPAE